MDGLTKLWLQQTDHEAANILIGVHKLAAGIGLGYLALKAAKVNAWLPLSCGPVYWEGLTDVKGDPALGPRNLKLLPILRGMQIAAAIGVGLFVRRTAQDYNQIRLRLFGPSPPGSWWELEKSIQYDAWNTVGWQKHLDNFELIVAYKRHFWAWCSVPVTLLTNGLLPMYLSWKFSQRIGGSDSRNCLRQSMGI